MTRLLALLYVLFGTGLAWAQAPVPADQMEAGPEPLTLAELAERADLVALVQVADTDYIYARDFPSGGTAFLRVLIPYKVSRPLEDIIEVYEEGLHAHECYFPNPTVFEEGRRYLVFLRISQDVASQYRGLDQGCALEALVGSDNRYALRYPLNGMGLSGDYAALAHPWSFADPYAVVEEDAISPGQRNQWLGAGYLERHGEGYRYTHGIGLSTVRELLGPGALTLDRSLK